MSLASQFKTDQAKEVDGVEVKYGANDDGSIPTFRISRMSRSNVRYTKELEKATRPVRRLIDNERLDNMVAQDITLKVFVRSVLLGWDNVQDEKGKSIEFNEENALKLFRDLPDLYDDLSTQASKASLFRDDQLEKETKN